MSYPHNKIHLEFRGGTNGISLTYCGLKNRGVRGGEIRQTTCLNCIRALDALVQRLKRSVEPARTTRPKQKPLFSEEI